ncbi:MAG: flagellar hook protein FlgE [Thermodesulfovibrionales bacterium]|nr:flagellar hook protein FlgE [Thermodesulfovibrionales bacterium]
MITSLYTAVSGISANGTALTVIGDNIANINTVGFKGSRVAFGDILSQTLAGGSSQIGRGVIVTDVSPLFSQGSFQTSASVLDMAIDGDGFFIVKDSFGAKYYTRSGQFSLNKDGYVVNPEGLILQGYLADASGKILGEINDLNLGTTQSPPKMTANAKVAVNLDATATTPSEPFTLDGNGDGNDDDPANYNSSTTITVYDSQGGAHTVTLYFVKTGANTWEVHYVYANPDTTSSDKLIEAGTQTLVFDENGKLVDDNDDTPIQFNFGGSVVQPQEITFDFGTGTDEDPPGSGLDGTTQFASPFSVLSISQDGYAAGSLKTVTISEDGIITGIFTNGQTRILGQIALARFVASTGLLKMGRNLFAETHESGQPIVGNPTTSGLGRVLSNTLELSNVDLAEEFIKMISAQRGFQANSRVVSAVDDLMQELVNMKR